jgi:hypothetical protein
LIPITATRVIRDYPSYASFWVSLFTHKEGMGSFGRTRAVEAIFKPDVIAEANLVGGFEKRDRESVECRAQP